MIPPSGRLATLPSPSPSGDDPGILAAVVAGLRDDQLALPLARVG